MAVTYKKLLNKKICNGLNCGADGISEVVKAGDARRKGVSV